MNEALNAVLSRPQRSFLTILGSILGIGSFVAVLGLTLTASGQISNRFTELMATEVAVTVAPQATITSGLPVDAETRVTALPGVTYAGVSWPVRTNSETGVSGLPPGSVTRFTAEEPTPVIAASPGLLSAARARVTSGRGLDPTYEDRRERVAVLGEAAARRVGVTRLDTQPAVFIDEVPFTVVGIVTVVERRTDLQFSVIIPAATALSIWGEPEPSAKSLVVDTQVGAAAQVASHIPLALRPEAPENFVVVPPPDPSSLKDDVTSDMTGLFLVLAGVSLVAGAFGITNTTLVSVMERVPEIGLRRSVGAQPRHVYLQFLTESSILGLLGGVSGTSLGVIVVVAASAVASWTPLIEVWVVVGGPLVGALTGLLAGAYPAVRAARIEPARALRA